MAVALITFVVGMLLLRETRALDIHDEDHAGVDTRPQPVVRQPGPVSTVEGRHGEILLIGGSAGRPRARPLAVGRTGN